MSYHPERREEKPGSQRFGYNRNDVQESTTLYIGNLFRDISEHELRRLLESCGRIRSMKIGIAKTRQEFPGYAFVEFDSRREAEDAYHRFRGYEYDGVRLRVDWDLSYDRKRYQNRGRRPYGGGRSFYDRDRGHGAGDRGDRGYGGGDRGGRRRSPPRHRTSRYSPPPRRREYTPPRRDHGGPHERRYSPPRRRYSPPREPARRTPPRRRNQTPPREPPREERRAQRTPPRNDRREDTPPVKTDDNPPPAETIKREEDDHVTGRKRSRSPERERNYSPDIAHTDKKLKVE